MNILCREYVGSIFFYPLLPPVSSPPTAKSRVLRVGLRPWQRCREHLKASDGGLNMRIS